MKKVNPVIKIKRVAAEHSIRLSEKVSAKAAGANNFLTDVADVFLFIVTANERTVFRWL